MRTIHRVLRKGDSGGAVRKLQRRLNHAFPKHHTQVDGRFGPRTKRRVKTFQRRHHLTPDGIVGRGTWRRLGYRLVLPKGGRVLLAPGVRPAGPRLMRAIRAVARETGTDLLIKSGDRSQSECEHFWRVYRAGGALAANPWGCGGRCCSRHASGRAIDVGTLKHGVYRSIGYDARVMRSVHKHGMWLAVRWPSGAIREQWHLQMR